MIRVIANITNIKRTGKNCASLTIEVKLDGASCNDKSIDGIALSRIIDTLHNGKVVLTQSY